MAMVQMTRLAGVIILDHLTFSTARRVLICGFPSRLLYRKESRLMTQLTIRIRPPMLGLDTGFVRRFESSVTCSEFTDASHAVSRGHGLARVDKVREPNSKI